MFYSAIFSMLPQWTKNLLGAGFWIAGGIYAAHTYSLFPEFFGLEQYNQTVIE
jgi:hypothetical protein